MERCKMCGTSIRQGYTISERGKRRATNRSTCNRTECINRAKSVRGRYVSSTLPPGMADVLIAHHQERIARIEAELIARGHWKRKKIAGTDDYETSVDDGKVLTRERGVFGDPKTMGEVAAEIEEELGIRDIHPDSPLPRPLPSATRIAFTARGHIVNNAKVFVRRWPTAPHRPTAD